MGGKAERGSRRRRSSWWIGLVILLVYVGWILTPYLRSVIVREAAVTSWINVATSPIYGNVDARLPAPGQRVGANGQLLTVRNDRVDRGPVDLATAEVKLAQARVTQLTSYLAQLHGLGAERQALVLHYAETFKADMAIEANRTRQELDLVDKRLALARVSAARLDVLAKKGHTSQADADAAEAREIEMDLLREERQQTLEEDELRERAADRGVFLAADGSDPDWAFRSSDALKIETARTETQLADAQAALARAQAVETAASASLKLITERPVLVPPGSMIWSMIVGAGAAADVGTPVAEWLDCDAMLVDVPLSDVELALLHKGMVADVILEGERQTRHGRVLLTRGAAATLGTPDLAAIAKGRVPGMGQVILTLDHSPQDAERCPIGLAAYVDFPEVGLIDVLRARLRL